MLSFFFSSQETSIGCVYTFAERKAINNNQANGSLFCPDQSFSPKLAGSSFRARFPLMQENLGEGNRGDNGENFEPSLNQLDNMRFDPIVTPPSSRDERTKGINIYVFRSRSNLDAPGRHYFWATIAFARVTWKHVRAGWRASRE